MIHRPRLIRSKIYILLHVLSIFKSPILTLITLMNISSISTRFSPHETRKRDLELLIKKKKIKTFSLYSLYIFSEDRCEFLKSLAFVSCHPSNISIEIAPELIVFKFKSPRKKTNDYVTKLSRIKHRPIKFIQS